MESTTTANNKNEHQIDPDHVRMEKIIEELRTNATRLSKEIGYKSPASIFQILDPDAKNKTTRS